MSAVGKGVLVVALGATAAAVWACWSIASAVALDPTIFVTRWSYKSLGENANFPKTAIFPRGKLQLFNIGEDPGEESIFTQKV